MKNLILALILTIVISVPASAIEIDTLWYRYTGSGNQDVDFTPDDKYVVLWRNGIEFWEVQQGVRDFFITSEVLGDYNYNEEYLVFAQDSTPKLLNWKTREVVEGFEKQETFLGRIRTAKSKNEFMATKGHYPKVMYFWDINQKQILDSFEIMKECEKNNQKWGRSIHEYDYLGNSDEYFYIRVNDNNASTPNLPSKNEIDNFSYLIYNRETKELIDSLFAFQISFENYNHVDKMVVLNDRDNLAWNKKGGEINFYNIKQKRFYNYLVFDTHDFVEASDIEFNRLESIVGITHGKDLKIYNLQSKELVYYSNIGGKDNISFSNNEELLVAHVNSFLLLFPSHIVETSVEGTNKNRVNLTVTPNPASNIISIQFSTETNEPIKLSIIDLLGNEIGIIDEGNIENQNYSIDYNISNIPPSIYFIRLELGSEIFTKKFIKE